MLWKAQILKLHQNASKKLSLLEGLRFTLPRKTNQLFVQLWNILMLSGKDVLRENQTCLKIFSLRWKE